MSTAQVINAAITSPASRVAQARFGSSTLYQTVDALESGAFSTPTGDQPRRYEYEEDFEPRRRRRPMAQFQDQVISFGGVLVSQEVGTAIMQAQAVTNSSGPKAGDAERGIAIYEFNQALMGAPQVST